MGSNALYHKWFEKQWEIAIIMDCVDNKNGVVLAHKIEMKWLRAIESIQKIKRLRKNSALVPTLDLIRG